MENAGVVPKEMKDDYEIWNIFHDGDITKITGDIPGDPVIRVEIPYLRQMIRPTGTAFFVTLHGCLRFEYEPFEGQSTADPRKIGELKPEVLSVEEAGGVLRIACVDGTIVAAYDRVTCTLDNGEAAGFDDLTYACERYWREWEERRHNHTQEPIGAKRASGSA